MAIIDRKVSRQSYIRIYCSEERYKKVCYFPTEKLYAIERTFFSTIHSHDEVIGSNIKAPVFCEYGKTSWKPKIVY